jgi:hypothetical protein
MMRKTLLATVAAVSFVTVGISAANAAPVSGAAINDTAAATSLTQKVWWHHHWWHHHCWWHHGYRHCD